MTTDLRKARLAGMLTVVVALVAACGSGGEAAPTATVSGGVEASRTGPPSPQVPAAWPLTGVASDDVVARPALAVKIENSPEARPQTGLEQADIVWEEIVEGGITRFVAVYHSQVPEQVGPVRSVRPVDPAIVAPMRGILAYTGGQQPFIDAVTAAGVQSVYEDHGDAGFSRVKARRAPHNVMGDPATFWEQDDGSRTSPPPAQFSYGRPGAATASASGAPVGRIDVTMSPTSTPVWEWNAETETFWRSEGAKPAESSAGVRLAATNVVLLSVEVSDTRYKDPAGARVPDMKLVGSGEGLVASGGKSVPVTWSKDAVEAPLVLTDANGAVKLEPGTTWVELVPVSTGGYALS